MLRLSLSALRALLCGAAVLSLVACGGEDDAPSPAPPPVAGGLVISEANATRVAAEAVGSLAASVSVSADVLGLEGAGAKSLFAARRTARALAFRVAAADRIRPLAVDELEVDCVGGGTLKQTTSTAANDAATPGDFFEQVFSDCGADNGVILSGSLRQTLVATNADETVRTFDVAATDLAAELAGVEQKVNGTARVVADASAAAGPRTTTTSNLINSERRVNGTVVATHRISGLQREEVLNIATGDITLSTRLTASGTFPVLGEVSFTVETPQPLVAGADPFFNAGQVKVVGSGNTSVLITALGDGNGSINLKVDTNGDGANDVEQTVTLAQLAAQFQTVIVP